MKENVEINFAPEMIITEAEKGAKGIKLGGTALVQGKSKNDVKYSFKNLQENDGRPFKWLVGHPKEQIEEHVVGKGILKLVDGNLVHEGMIMNTARYPDVVEKVQAGLLGPSIHATSDKMMRTKEGTTVDGLDIKGVSLVAFQGIKEASIDYIIAESLKEEQETTESLTDEKDNDRGGIMEETNTPAPVVEDNSKERIAILEQEILALKQGKKANVVESIIALNKNFKTEELLKESEEKLGLILEYEKKLAKMTPEAGIVEQEPVNTGKEIVESADGSVMLSESAYAKFNNEIIERIR